MNKLLKKAAWSFRAFVRSCHDLQADPVSPARRVFCRIRLLAGLGVGLAGGIFVSGQ